MKGLNTGVGSTAINACHDSSAVADGVIAFFFTQKQQEEDHKPPSGEPQLLYYD